MGDNKNRPPIKESQALFSDAEYAQQMESEFKKSGSKMDQVAKARIWSKIRAKVSTRTQSFWQKPQLIPMIGMAAVLFLVMLLKPFSPTIEEAGTRLKGGNVKEKANREWIKQSLTIWALQKTEVGYQATDIEKDGNTYIIKPDQMVSFVIDSSKYVHVGLYLSSDNGDEFNAIFLSGPLAGDNAEVGTGDQPFSFAPKPEEKEVEICSLISESNSVFPKKFSRGDKIMRSANCYLFRR